MANPASQMRPRFRDIHLAGVLLTRLPLPRLDAGAFHRSADATWSYPIVGLVLGSLAASVWWLAAFFGMPVSLQAGLALGALILMTGALHEDGLADTADGLWGGHDPRRRLEIMKDSRIGSYGVLALILGIGLRWSALIATGPLALIAAACLSRAILPMMMLKARFARDDGLARSVGRPPDLSAWSALAIGGVIALFCAGPLAALLATIAAIAIGFGIARVARHKIGGITGDILGAAQQNAEILVLLTLLTL